jgi:ribosome recycling factor
MEEILLEAETLMEEAIENLEKRFNNVRAGRANPSILEPVMVEYYGTLTPIKQIANISIPEARQLMIKPFDKSILSLIEKAIYEANIGLTPNNTGEVIYLNIPPLTETTRKELVKEVNKMKEDAKIQLRNIRQDANNDLKKEELPEDMERSGQNEVQKLIDKFNKIVDEKTTEKEKELMSV